MLSGQPTMPTTVLNQLTQRPTVSHHRAVRLAQSTYVLRAGYVQALCFQTRKPRNPCTSASTSTDVLSASAYDAVFSDFRQKVQGEWDGVTVTFGADGRPQALPDRFVPEAYREWGVEVFDWQSQCSTWLAEADRQPSDNARALCHKVRRLMPTVGCEADAVAYEEEDEDVWQASSGSAVHPVARDGSYVSAPSSLPSDSGRVRVDMCVACGMETTETVDQRPPRLLRVRAVVRLMRDWQSGEWRPMTMDLFRETFDAPYNGGQTLGGCAGGNAKFAETPAVTEEQLAQGTWQVESSMQYVCAGDGQVEVVEGSAKPSRLPTVSSGSDSLVKLPIGAWLHCSSAAEDLQLQFGVLATNGERKHVASCAYKAGRLVSVHLSTEVNKK